MNADLYKAHPFWGLAFNGHLILDSLTQTPRLFASRDEANNFQSRMPVTPVRVFIVVEDD